MPERPGGREALNEKQQDLKNGKAFTYSVTWRKHNVLCGLGTQTYFLI